MTSCGKVVCNACIFYISIHGLAVEELDASADLMIFGF